jgi:hypothetical protein
MLSPFSFFLVFHFDDYSTILVRASTHFNNVQTQIFAFWDVVLYTFVLPYQSKKLTNKKS